jgi:hypothetical protein
VKRKQNNHEDEGGKLYFFTGLLYLLRDGGKNQKQKKTEKIYFDTKYKGQRLYINLATEAKKIG